MRKVKEREARAENAGSPMLALVLAEVVLYMSAGIAIASTLF